MYMTFPRIDLYFSYWIFLWFVLYYYHVTQYNPKWLLLGGLIVNIIMLILMLVYKNCLFYVTSFIIAVIVTKILPLYLVWNKETTPEDIGFGLGLSIVFVLYFRFMTGSFFNSIKGIFKNIQEGKTISPILFWLYGKHEFDAMI
jgi:hypothetical protein